MFHGHRVQVKTLDHNQPWPDISSARLSLLEGPSLNATTTLQSSVFKVITNGRIGVITDVTPTCGILGRTPRERPGDQISNLELALLF